MPQPNLSHLVVFAAVARLNSFQRAGVESGMSASAVSHAIRGLEERLGVSLFNRTTRSVSLTEAGQRLLERLQPVLRDVGEAIDEMNHFRSTPTGTLRIDAPRIVAQMLIIPMIPKFLAAYPGIQFELVQQDGFVDIVAGGCDAGIRYEDVVPEDMVGVRLDRAVRWAVVATPDYFARYPVPLHPNDLSAHDCIRIRFPSGRYFRWEFGRDGADMETEVHGRLTVGDADTAVLAALDGVGLAVSFEDAVAAHIAEGRLVRVLEEWCPPFSGFMLYYPRQRRMSSALRAFIDMLRAHHAG